MVQGSSLGSGSQGLDLEGYKVKGLRFELRACRPGRMRVDMHITHVMRRHTEGSTYSNMTGVVESPDLGF